jgi:hypothetical protein
MEVPPLLVQTAGSLVAILALAGLARWLKLGAAPRLASADDVRRAAGEVEDGFVPVATTCDAGGAGALARDAGGRIMLIRRHGNRFAGRVLTAQARALRPDPAGPFNVIVDCAEPRFGRTFLALDDAEAWADAINRVSGPGNA